MIHGQMIGIFSGGGQEATARPAGVREHAGRDWNRRCRRAIQPQRVVSPVNAERRVDHRQEHLELEASRHSRPPVRRSQNLQLIRGLRIQNASRSATGARRSARRLAERGTAELLADHLIVLHLRNLQLRRPDNRIDSQIREWRYRHRPINRDAVFKVGDNAQISARESDLIYRDGNRQIPKQRIQWILQNRSSIGICKRDRSHTRQKGYRRSRTNVEAAEIVLATEIRALEWGRNQAAIATNERSLNVEAQSVAPVLHRNKFLVLHDGANRTNRSANSSQFSTRGELLPMVG